MEGGILTECLLGRLPVRCTLSAGALVLILPNDLSSAEPNCHWSQFLTRFTLALGGRRVTPSDATLCQPYVSNAAHDAADKQPESLVLLLRK